MMATRKSMALLGSGITCGGLLSSGTTSGREIEGVNVPTSGQTNSLSCLLHVGKANSVSLFIDEVLPAKPNALLRVVIYARKSDTIHRKQVAHAKPGGLNVRHGV